jgi:nicotinamide riboside kinase
MSALVVSFFGGPGAGKSTMAAGVFYELKRRRINCEFVHEYAKELAWEGRAGALSNQTFILGQQFEMFRRCADQVDIIITDTSLLNSAIYCHNYDLSYAAEIEFLAVKMYKSMNNFPFLVKRVQPYSSVGRYQNEEEADRVAEKVRSTLLSLVCHNGFLEVNGDEYGLSMALDEITKYMSQLTVEQ